MTIWPIAYERSRKASGTIGLFGGLLPAGNGSRGHDGGGERPRDGFSFGERSPIQGVDDGTGPSERPLHARDDVVDDGRINGQLAIREQLDQHAMEQLFVGRTERDKVRRAEP